MEIGTGWGGFAMYAARTRGCHVTTTTISREQRDYAVAAVRAAGLEDRVEVLLEDYRDLRGRYDKLVSIEMIEAVGWQHFGTFFAQCSRLLEPDGAMLLQAITIDDRAYDVQKAAKSFINTHIFPNGCLPSLEVIARSVARRTDLQIAQLEDLTPHYVETLRRWRETFGATTPSGRRARLRRALPAAVDAVSRLLRGRLRRAADLPRADAAHQAAVAQRARGGRGASRSSLGRVRRRELCRGLTAARGAG